VKLFIGQIPKGYNVEQIKNLFTNCGKEHIKDVHIITDPTTGQGKGQISSTKINALKISF
jgi:RNA recognition motif-containing protein